MDCGYSIESPQRGGSNEYHNLCFEQKYEKISEFLFEIFQFMVVKCSIYFNKRVFVMRMPEGTFSHLATHMVQKVDYDHIFIS